MYYSHYKIIKCIGLELIHYIINLDIMSSFKDFNKFYYVFLSNLIFFYKKTSPSKQITLIFFYIFIDFTYYIVASYKDSSVFDNFFSLLYQLS